jgi:uncharacterized protein (DUF885 family)
MTPAFRLCDQYVSRWASLDPVMATSMGLREPFAAATDYGPDGIAARAELIAGTLAALADTAVTCADDELAVALLRERLAAEAAWYETGGPLRELRAEFGLITGIRDSVDLLPRGTADGWRDIAARLTAIPRMLTSWRAALEAGLRQGLPAARRQALATAELADGYAGTHDRLLAGYGDGPLAAGLATAASQAHQGYAEMARYLREDYAPRAAQADAVGPERYAVEARLRLGADVDFTEAYQWGWAELRRIETELAAEAGRVQADASVGEAAAILDQTAYVTGPDAYLAWLRDRHGQAISRLDGRHFDIPAPLRTIDVVSSAPGSAGPYYTAPSEDLTRPGRTWWPLGGRERYPVWRDLTKVFHEGVPGHHLQIGTALMAGDRLSRFAKCTHVPGHSEGWAKYAERLADELGWYTEPGTRLGMLLGAASSAALLVMDIGLHLDLPLPDGSRWSFATAREVLSDRGLIEPQRVEPLLVRACAWPARGTVAKLGERAWLAARDEAARDGAMRDGAARDGAVRGRPGFDLRRWHTAALGLGTIGLAGLASTLLRRAGHPPDVTAAAVTTPGT